MLVGYARVSTQDQQVALQEDALHQASALRATYSSCSTYSQVSLSQRGQIRGGMPPLYLP